MKIASNSSIPANVTNADAPRAGTGRVTCQAQGSPGRAARRHRRQPAQRAPEGQREDDNVVLLHRGALRLGPVPDPEAAAGGAEAAGRRGRPRGARRDARDQGAARRAVGEGQDQADDGRAADDARGVVHAGRAERDGLLHAVARVERRALRAAQGAAREGRRLRVGVAPDARRVLRAARQLGEPPVPLPQDAPPGQGDGAPHKICAARRRRQQPPPHAFHDPHSHHARYL